MPSRVTINRESLKAHIRARLAAHLQGGSVSHSNRDGVWSPSQWDVTADRLTRHSLQTSGSVRVEEGKVYIRLTYEVVTIPARV